MSNTKKIIFIVIFMVFIISLIFVYNDDFLYSNQIIKITKIDTINEETSQNSLGLEEKYYTREITGIITNGNQKGKEKPSHTMNLIHLLLQINIKLMTK